MALEKNLFMFVTLRILFSLTMVPFISQKLPENGLTIEVFNRSSIPHTVERYH